MNRPILYAIRELVKYKGWTTIPEIASFTGIKKMDVLHVVNKNAALLHMNKAKARITGDKVRSAMASHLWSTGKYYRRTSYGAWCHEGWQLKLTDKHPAYEGLAESILQGGLGDSWTTQIIHDTPENRAALEAEGITDYDSAIIDDSEWLEGNTYDKEEA